MENKISKRKLLVGILFTMALLNPFNTFAETIKFSPKISFNQARENKNLREQYVKERIPKALDLIEKIYGKETKNKITKIVYIPKVTGIGTHFTEYERTNIRDIFNHKVRIKKLGITADAFEGGKNSVINNDADFFSALAGKEGGLVWLVNNGARGLTWKDFAWGKTYFNQKIYTPFAESYTFGLVYKEIMELYFIEFGMNSQKCINHNINFYLSQMAKTLLNLISKGGVRRIERDESGRISLFDYDPRLNKIMKTLLNPVKDYLPRNKRISIDKGLLKRINFSKKENKLTLTFRNNSYLDYYLDSGN